MLSRMTKIDKLQQQNKYNKYPNYYLNPPPPLAQCWGNNCIN